MISKTVNYVEGYRLRAIEECPSTNTLCMDFAGAGELGNLWVVAEKQTSAKGSRGRKWISQSGNLHASLLLHDPSPKEHLAELTFVAAIAVRETLARIIPNADIQHKWPNDILLNSKKCSGILLESKSTRSGTYVVVGIGINCSQYPEDSLLHKATSLTAEGVEISPEAVFQILADEMAKAIAQWNKGNGFSDIRNRWLEHASGIGQEIKVRIPGRDDFRGIFASIDDAGYMLLETSDKQLERISTADIFFT